MLVLTRRIGEVVVIGDEVRVRVISVKGDRVRLGITAPTRVRVDREEVHDRRELMGATPAGGRVLMAST